MRISSGTEAWLCCPPAADGTAFLLPVGDVAAGGGGMVHASMPGHLEAQHQQGMLLHDGHAHMQQQHMPMQGLDMHPRDPRRPMDPRAEQWPGHPDQMMGDAQGGNWQHMGGGHQAPDWEPLPFGGPGAPGGPLGPMHRAGGSFHGEDMRAVSPFLPGGDMPMPLPHVR
jgi:hypothetical protein